MDHALFESKSLVKQLAMRRTLFVFPRDLLPAAVSSPSARVASQQVHALVKDLERNQVTDDGECWLATAREAALRRLAGGAELSARGLREDLVELSGQVSWYEHKPYGAVLHVAPRVLSWLSATGDLVRGGARSDERHRRLRAEVEEPPVPQAQAGPQHMLELLHGARHIPAPPLEYPEIAVHEPRVLGVARLTQMSNAVR
jgi:hypothetical protein